MTVARRDTTSFTQPLLILGLYFTGNCEMGKSVKDDENME